MGMPGLPEMIVIFAVLFLLFGAKKLPDLGGAIGESIKNFKKGMKDPTPDTPVLAAKPEEPVHEKKEEQA